jgi:hypothetical protein
MSSFWRRLKEENGWGRVWSGLAIAICLAGGGLVYQTYADNSPASGTANLWVDTNGGTCTRQASAAGYVDAAACSSLDAAFDAASCSDTVLIKGGTYGSQTITGAKSCSSTWTVGSSRGVTCTGCVKFAVESAATVALGGITTSGANYFQLSRGSGADLNVNGGWGIVGSGNSQIVQGADFVDDIFLNAGTPGPGPFTNIALVDGSVGGFTLAPGRFLAVYLQTCASCGPNATIASNILIDGVNFHDITTPNTADHTGVIRVDGGYDTVIVRNSNFYDNITVTTSSVQTTNIGTGGIDPVNFQLINNYFGNQGTATRSMNYNSALATCTDYKILYNTSLIPLYVFGCTSETGSVTAGNLAPWAPGTDCFGTHVKNLWSNGSSSGCGSDATAASAGLGGSSGFDIQPGSAAIRAGETTYCPATDHDGNARPNPGETNCDAGAFESSGS